FLSKKITTINTSLELDFDLAKTKLEPFDKEKVARVFRQLEFKSLLAKINDLAGQTQPHQATMSLSTPQITTGPGTQKTNYNLVADKTALAACLTKLTEQTIIALDTETTSLNVFEAKLLGISLAWQAGLAYYLSIKDLPKDTLTQLGKILSNQKIVGHNLKYDYAVLSRAGLTLPVANLYFDTLIAAYLLTSANRNLDLDSLAFTEFGYSMQPIEDLLGPRGKDQLTMDQVPAAKVSWYSCEDVDFTFRLFKKYEPAIKAAGNEKLFQDVEMPLIAVLADMEKTGILIDQDFLKNLAKEFRKDIKKIEQKVYRLAGQEFNLASPLQLKEILFDKLQISTKGLKKTKTGISTAANELEKMSGLHPIIDLMSEFRELSKLQNTYVEALPEQTDSLGRIHTSFNQTVTTTGRLSSSNPNLQNIPIRTPLGQQIRKAFIAPRGWQLLSADYSQIELRIIASLSGDQNMIKTFQRNEDIHAKTAAFIHNIPLDKVDSFQRRSAKEINFGIIYGLGSTGLAQRAKISRDQAKDFIAKYFASYPKIKAWLDETKIQARELGYVETLFGRRRYLPEINSTVPMIRASAERMAINAPIQGTAADLLKMAMVKVWLGLPKISAKSKLLLTVHDELVLEVPTSDIPAVSKFVQTTMETICELKVPIKVHIEAGKNWQEAK
ncbi:MAG: DNA polymerase I, partial [Candidatus Komeilibacteria bacterium]|nr:DNA polymerase I [Candidatus Komeilibacteria bacterium]